MYRADVMSRGGAESGSRRSKKNKQNKQKWLNREEEQDSKTMDKGLNVFFLSGEGRGGGGSTQGDRRKKEGIVLPEFIVAGC